MSYRKILILSLAAMLVLSASLIRTSNLSTVAETVRTISAKPLSTPQVASLLGPPLEVSRSLAQAFSVGNSGSIMTRQCSSHRPILLQPAGIQTVREVLFCWVVDSRFVRYTVVLLLEGATGTVLARRV